VTLRRVAPDPDGCVLITALGLHGLPVALFYQNDFHVEYLEAIGFGDSILKVGTACCLRKSGFPLQTTTTNRQPLDRRRLLT
jgi:hypothetical protein